MTKDELRRLIEEQTQEFGHVPVHPERVDQAARHKRRMKSKTIVVPKNLAQEEWDRYLKSVADGTYRPEYKPEVKLYDWESL